MLPPYAKPAPRREPALQSRTTPIGLERSLFPLSSAAGGGRGPSPRNLSTSFWESASSIINRAFNSRSEIPANRGGSRARGRVGTARPDNGRAWAAGSLGAGAERGPRRGGASAEEQGGRTPSRLSRRGSKNGGRQPSERVAQAPPSPSFRSPRAAQEPSTAPSSRRLRGSPLAERSRGFADGGGAVPPRKRPRFPRRCCACAPPGGERWRAAPAEGPLLAPQLPPLSGQAGPVSGAVSSAASRGRSGPESAAAPLACGKCHQMAG